MAAPTGIKSPTRARIAARTLRTDRWWLYPTFTALVLLAFVAYATYRAFSGEHYFAEPYLTPFYSPCVTTECVGGLAHRRVVGTQSKCSFSSRQSHRQSRW